MTNEEDPKQLDAEVVDDGGTQETSIGTTQNVAGLLTYLLGWITGVVFLLIEKDNKFVRFQAMQSVVVFVTITIAWVVFGFIPVVGGILNLLLSLISLVLWLVLMYQAFQGNYLKLPKAGDYAETQLKNMGSK